MDVLDRKHSVAAFMALWLHLWRSGFAWERRFRRWRSMELDGLGHRVWIWVLDKGLGVVA